MEGRNSGRMILAASLAFSLGCQPVLAARITTTGTLRQPPAQNPNEAESPKKSESHEQISASEVDEQIEAEAEPVPEGPSLEEGGRLNLMCFGAGAANKADIATAFGSSSYMGTYGSVHGSSTATIVGRRSQGFEDQVSLRMTNNEGRLRMPRTMLPTIRGGKDGWFKLKDIKVKPGEITASVGVNILNNPKLRLDRYSGAISISGKAGDFTGQCRKFDPERFERKF